MIPYIYFGLTIMLIHFGGKALDKESHKPTSARVVQKVTKKLKDELEEELFK